MPKRKTVNRIDDNRLLLESGLSHVETQINNAWILLRERHGKDGSGELANKFIKWGHFGIGTHPADPAVQQWYYETSALLDSILEKSDPLAKRFKKIEKDRTIDDTHYLGPQFSTLESGNILRDGIVILEKVSLYLSSQIKLLESTQTTVNPNKNFLIFISHINENREIAEKLKEFFEKTFHKKIDVFISSDPESISLSQDWYEKIKEGIKNCNLMIILCTPDSIKRPWINFEAGAAAILDKNVGPICFQGLTVSKLTAPLNASRPQAIDSMDEIHFKKHFDKLLESIAKNSGLPIPDDNVLESEFYQKLKG